MAMAEDYTFNRTAHRPAPVIEGPTMQWATGLPTDDRRVYAGWLVESGRLEELDLCMQDAGFKEITIKHGSGKFVSHWAVECANVFLIADSVQMIGDFKHSDRLTGMASPRRYGIAFGWRAMDSGRMQSVLKCRVILRQLAMHGYLDPITISVKSTLTGDLIAALMRQYDVLEAADAFRVLDKRPVLNPPLYAASLPLVAGQEVTRGATGASKEISPMIADVPNPITREYLRAHWIWKALIPTIESLMDETIAWSVEESKRIAEGQPQAVE